MIEYIANRINEDGEEEAVRFIGKGNFAMTKNGVATLVPDDFDQDPKELLGENFEGMAEFRTFYDTEAGQFRLVEYHEHIIFPDSMIPIPYDGGEICGWQVGRLDKKMQQNNQETKC